MERPLFSILIAQYNNGKYFQDCYQSILAQDYANWEVIIVDDGSTDDSVEVIKNMIGEDPRFTFYENSENKGCGYTKRRCAALAKGELCAFLDPDDAITPDALSLMVAEHEKHPDAAIIYSKLYFCDAELNITSESKTQQVENGNPYFFNFDGFVFHFLAYKNESYKKTVGIDSYLQRAVDQDLVLKLYEVGPGYMCDKALYKYRVHEQGISNTTNLDKAYYWYWVAIIDAAKRRDVNIEHLYLEKALIGRKQIALQKEIDAYNRSFIFKALRKLGLFRIFIEGSN